MRKPKPDVIRLDPHELYSTHELAARTGMNERTLRDAAVRGDLPEVFMGKARYFSGAALLAHFAGQSGAGGPARSRGHE